MTTCQPLIEVKSKKYPLSRKLYYLYNIKYINTLLKTISLLSINKSDGLFCHPRNILFRFFERKKKQYNNINDLQMEFFNPYTRPKK